MESKIFNVELCSYFCFWIFANIFSLYKLYEEQTNILASHPALFHSIVDLEPGWRMVSRFRDVSDIEWSSWKYFIQSFWHCLIVQFLVSELVRKTNVSLLKYWYILSSVFFVISNMGYRQLIVIITQPVIFYTIIISGGKKISIWLIGILILISYNTLKYNDIFWYFLDHEEIQDEEVYLLLFTVAWIELRCISFCIDFVDKRDKCQNVPMGYIKRPQPSAGETLVNMFSYILYLPLMYTGPLILYEDFEKSFNVAQISFILRLKTFLWDNLLFLFYSFILDLAFHYIYFFAMQSHVEALRKLPAIALCGGGLWMGVVFHLKYVISYGTTAAFARLDHIIPPPTPRCIARVHVYSQMWRYFDVGLYKFLVKYIYKPSFKTLSENVVFSEMMNKYVASFATFVFIFMWHGTSWNIFIWTALNYFGIILEYTSKAISETSKYEWFRKHILKTEQMETRFISLLCTPLLALSAISNFYLFAGTNIGNLFFQHSIHPNFWNSVVVSLALYSCCQVSIALKDVSSRTDQKKIDIKVIQ